MQENVPPLEIAEEMGELAGDLLPVTGPLMEYMHNRYLRFYIEQDVVGHMEADIGGAGRGLARGSMTFCFVDLTGFTPFTAGGGGEESPHQIQRFVGPGVAAPPKGAP